MKKFSQLHEELKGKTAVMTFGRMNPPTTGHAKLIDHVLKQKGDHHVYVSHSTDRKKNPLTGEEKVGLLHKMYPDHKDTFKSSSSESPTFLHAASDLHKSGYHHLHMVVGSDRVDDMKEKLNKYNGVKGAHGHYNFKSITVSSAGDRDPDAEGTEGMSASKMRAHAKSGNVDEFKKGLHPSLHDHAHEIMKRISSRLDEDYDREDYLQGKLFKVGDIVESTNGQAEIIALGTNYVTLVQDGKTFKDWISNVKLIETKDEQSKLKVKKESITFKGYTTKNFTPELCEVFKKIAPKFTDTYAFFNCIVSCDKLLGASKSDIIESFDKYKIEYERATKYFGKFGLSSSILSDQEDVFLEHAFTEGVSFSAVNKDKIASIIACTADIKQENKTPEETINETCEFHKRNKLSEDGWKALGRMLNRATESGIKWNKDIWHTKTQHFMGLK